MSEQDIISAIAEAVKQELAAGEFSQTFVPQRSYRPRFKLQDMDVLHVTVVAQSVVSEPVTRSSTQYDCKIDIGIQQRLSQEDNAIIDRLMDLVQELADFLQGRVLTQCPAAKFMGVERDPLYSPQHLDQQKQFTSVLTVSYRQVV